MNFKFLSLCSVLTLGAAFQTADAAPDLIAQFPVKGGVAGASTSKKRGPSQSQLALKGAFPSVAKAQLSGALDAKNLALATKTVGKTAIFSGVVDRVYLPKSGKTVLLNFAKDYKTALVGSVMAKDYRQFPDLTKLKGQRVAVKGKVVLYKGLPQIELSGPGAIRLVK